MSTTGQGITGSWNERRRLIRLRRKKERPRLWEELRIVPKWLVWLLLSLFVIAQIVGLLVNLSGAANNGELWPTDFKDHPVIASLALAGIITAAAIPLTAYFLALGYIYRDAKRREMHAGLWTLLVLILSPAYLLIGFIIYFLVREPLPYPCPRCSNLVGPRFNFCPSCKCDLHPSCPSCKREIAETDKFCPYCATELAARASDQNSTTPAGSAAERGQF
jgi:hypothetical protein